MKKLNAVCLSALLTCLSLPTAQIATAVSYGNDNIGCLVDRPCLYEVYQYGSRILGNNIVFDFSGISGWDFYRFRYKNTKNRYTTVDQKSSIFVLQNTQLGSTYKIEVQGCYSSRSWLILKKETCSPWVQQSFTTR
jgi:hypothetical protein